MYGDGSNVRDWLYVKDGCRIVYDILALGKISEIYNVTHNNEMTNLQLVRHITDHLDVDFKDSIEFIIDRPGHDFRYSISNEKVKQLKSISEPTDFNKALIETILFYSDESNV